MVRVITCGLTRGAVSSSGPPSCGNDSNARTTRSRSPAWSRFPAAEMIMFGATYASRKNSRSDSEVNDSTVSGDPTKDLSLVADPELKLFQKYGAYDREAKHATIAFDAEGKEVFRAVGATPLMDAGAVIESLKVDATRARSE